MVTAVATVTQTKLTQATAMPDTLHIIWTLLLVAILGGIIFMATGLTALQAAVTDLQSKVAAVDADVKRLIANATGGPQPGQVIVNQADIDALTASIGAATGTLAADDTAANPPPPAPAAATPKV
jgi:hypothetical protein